MCSMRLLKLRGLENCFSIQLYSFQIFSPHEAHLILWLFYIFFSSSIHPFNVLIPLDSRSFSWEFFLCFFFFPSQFFFQFPLEWKSLEHYCNFFSSFQQNLFFLLLQLLQPPTTLPTFLFYFHSLLYIAIATADTPTTKSYSFYTLHVLAHHSHYTQNGWIFSFFFFFPFSRWMIEELLLMFLLLLLLRNLWEVICFSFFFCLYILYMIYESISIFEHFVGDF